MVICITFMNAQKDTEKIICLVNLILQSLLNVLATIFILSFSPDFAEGLREVRAQCQWPEEERCSE